LLTTFRRAFTGSRFAGREFFFGGPQPNQNQESLRVIRESAVEKHSVDVICATQAGYRRYGQSRSRPRSDSKSVDGSAGLAVFFRCAAQWLSQSCFAHYRKAPTHALDACAEISLGTTEIPEELFLEFLGEAAARFTPQTYDLFSNNCNNFSNEAALFLTVGAATATRVCAFE
jgi:hypothetical protein